MLKLNFGVILLIVSTPVFASFEVHPGSNSFHSVKLAESAQVKVADRSFNLSPIGYGIRIKHVFVIDAKVYVAELFGSDQTKFVHTSAGALPSLDLQKGIALKLTFLRDVEEAKIRASFREGLTANKVDIMDPSVHSFLEVAATAGDVHEGSTFVIIGEHLDAGKEAITYENSKAKTTTVLGGAGFIKQIFSIWLGESSDDGLAELKKSIIGEKQ